MGNFQDLTGKSFGLLTVIRRVKDVVYKNGQPVSAWLCKCECGKTKAVVGVRLRGGKVKSCGCEYVKKRSNKLVNQKFGRLTVLSRVKEKYHHVRWNCVCACGKTTTVVVGHLRSGMTKSCGCLRKNEFGLSTKRYVFKQTQKSAEKRNLPFDLTFDDFVSLSEHHCAYCGEVPRLVTKPGYHGYWKKNGLDRVDNAKGYTIQNCVPCCEWCNRTKSARSVKEFLEHVTRIVAYQNRELKEFVR